MAKAEKGSTPRFKYSVADVAEAVGIQPASVRVGLRDSEFERVESRWGWNTQKEFDAVVKYFKGRAENKPAMEKGKAPAKTKKTAAKSTKGKSKKAA